MSPRAIAVLILVRLSWCGVSTALPGEQLPDVDLAQVRTEFWAAIGANGTTYEAFRDRLLHRGQAIVPVLDDYAKHGETWPERTMAWILLERLQKTSQVEAILRSQPRLPPVRGVTLRWQQYSKALAKRCAETPMLLVERVWKHNKLKWGLPSEARIYAAIASGLLGEQRAVYPLIDMVEEGHPLGVASPPFLLAACVALRELGSSAAMPALLRTFVTYGAGPPGTVCGEAIKRCIDKDTTLLVQRFAHHVRDVGTRNFLLDLADRKELELERERARRKRKKD